jgi:hypothetical protein
MLTQKGGKLLIALRSSIRLFNREYIIASRFVNSNLKTIVLFS